MKAPCYSPLRWTCGFCFPCCYAHKQREEILDLTGEQYVCCGGICGCGPLSEPCENRQPWLCLEASCCTHNAILGNRFMLQTRFDIGNDPCDERVLQFYTCMNCLACIVSLLVDPDTADNIRDIVECINASICSCLLVQHDAQLQVIKDSLGDNTFGGMPQAILLALPPKQQEMYGKIGQPAPAQEMAARPGGAPLVPEG